MSTSTREQDENLESIINKFLDNKFYSNFVTEFKRITELNEQVIGVDSKFKYNDFYYICDEKAAVKYANKNLNTFAFELSFINRCNERQLGWLLDESKINNSYLLVYINRAKYNEFRSEDDIYEIEILLVRKIEVINLLKNKGWTLNNLQSKCNKIIYDKDQSFGDLKLNGVKFSHSKHLVESPVNILIKREDLRNISDIHKVIRS